MKLIFKKKKFNYYYFRYLQRGIGRFENEKMVKCELRGRWQTFEIS